jgi:tRNA(Ile)-lysidine synthase
MLNFFFDFINRNNILSVRDRVLLAVSGGVDSVVMAHLFYRAGLNFAIAHCKFGLRRDDQAKEAALVNSLADDYGVEFYSTEFDTKGYSSRHGVSIQMAARKLRYEWFNDLCVLHGFDKVATAHHLNDSLETSLFNLVKGTGIRGLRGIVPVRGKVVRPLLFATKQIVLDYAQLHGLVWCEDLSNVKNDYHRNLLRNAVIPQLKSINLGLEKSFVNTSKRLSLLEAFFDDYMESLKKEIIKHYGDSVCINVSYIIDKPWFIVIISELLRPFGFSFGSLDDFFSKPHQSGKLLRSKTYELSVVPGGNLVVAPLSNTVSVDSHMIDDFTSLVQTPSFSLSFFLREASGYSIDGSRSVAALDFDKLCFPLTLRRWRYGDKFYPLGVNGSKKVSDFLINSKVPVSRKSHIYVLESAGEIVWVVNFRLDNRFKINRETKKIYIVKCEEMERLS